jgi:hypothetical protein
LGYFGLISRFFKQSWQVSLFILTNAIILYLYVFALLGFLSAGIISFDVIGIALLLYRLIKQPRVSMGYKNYYQLVWLLPFIVFLRAIPRDYRFTMSDEFPSLGANIKELFREDALGGIHSATRSIASGFYQSYPPAQELFQYLFLKHTYWSEANVLTAQVVLVLICLLAFTSLLSSHSQVISILTFFSSIVVYYLFGFTLSNILADGLLAVQFAVCLALALKIRNGKRNFALLGATIAVLVLIKPTGFILAICASLFALVNYWVSKRLNNSNDSQKQSPKGLVTSRIPELLIVSAPILAYLSWQVHLSQIKMKPGVPLPSWNTITSPEFAYRWTLTWEAYKENFFGSLYGADNLAGRSLSAPSIVEQLHISLFSIIAILAITQIVLAVRNKHESKRAALSLALMMTSFAIAYQVFLLVLYMFFFGDYEGVRVAALVRYSGAFLLAWTLLVFVLFLQELPKFKSGKILLAATFLLIPIAAPSALASDLKGIKSDPGKLAARLDVEAMVPATLKTIKPDDKVFYIYQNSTGFEKYIFSYLILPIESNWVCPSIGKPYSSSDVWTCDLKLPSLLQGYTYLVAGRADSVFWKDNARYLASGSKPMTRGIYRISGTETGLLLQQITMEITE